MTRKTAAISTSTVFTLLFVLSQVTQAEKRMAITPTSLEIFATADQPISAIDTFVQEHLDIGIRVHKLDAIKGLEDKLSQGLSTDPDKSKRRSLYDCSK